jgi:hypothetical protein
MRLFYAGRYKREMGSSPFFFVGAFSHGRRKGGVGSLNE